MRSLIIDTSTEKGLIAIFDDENLSYEKELACGYQNSRNLLPELDNAFLKSGFKPEELELVIAGVGPGSYTGIRFGAMVAKTLAYVNQIPLVGVCSLMSFIPQQDGSFAAILDAKIGGVYLLKGVKRGDRVDFLGEPLLCPLQELQSSLVDVQQLVGPSISLLKLKLGSIIATDNWQWIESSPNALMFEREGRKKLKAGTFTQDAQLDLIYLRKTQAEIEKGQSYTETH